MQTDVNIRLATLSDLNDILRIENSSFDRDRFSRRQFGYLISKANGAFYVAVSERGLMGYISLLKRSGSEHLRIYSIAVHPDFRGQKIGQLLIDKAKTYATTCHLNQISLEVRTDNTDALKLYRSNGFEIRAVISEYYGDRSDAFKMVNEEF